MHAGIKLLIFLQLLCLGLRAQYIEFDLPEDQKFDCSLALNDSTLLIGGSNCTTYRPSSISNYKGSVSLVFLNSDGSVSKEELVLPKKTIRIAELIQNPATNNIYIISEILDNGYVIPYIIEYTHSLSFVAEYIPEFSTGYNYEIQRVHIKEDEFIIGYCLLNSQGDPLKLQLAKLNYDGNILDTVTVSDSNNPRFLGSICDGFSSGELIVTRLSPTGDEIHLIDTNFNSSFQKTLYNYPFDGHTSYNYYNSIGSIVKNGKYYLSLTYLYLRTVPRLDKCQGIVLVLDQNFDSLKTITFFNQDNRRFQNTGFSVDEGGNIYNTGYFDDQGYYPQGGETNSIHCSKINADDEVEWVRNYPVPNAAVDTYSNLLFRGNTMVCTGSAYMNNRTEFNDAFVFLISKNGEVGIKEKTASNFTLFPNPCTSDLILSGSEDGSFINIYSPVGELVTQKIVKNSRVDLSELTDGLYFLSCRNGTFKVVKK